MTDDCANKTAAWGSLKIKILNLRGSLWPLYSVKRRKYNKEEDKEQKKKVKYTLGAAKQRFKAPIW